MQTLRPAHPEQHDPNDRDQTPKPAVVLVALREGLCFEQDQAEREGKVWGGWMTPSMDRLRLSDILKPVEPRWVGCEECYGGLNPSPDKSGKGTGPFQSAWCEAVGIITCAKALWDASDSLDIATELYPASDDEESMQKL